MAAQTNNLMMRIHLTKYHSGILIGLFLTFLLPGSAVFAPPNTSNEIPVLSPPSFFQPSYKETYTALQNPWRIQPLYAGNIDSETLWLARAMFSETKRYDEQELVGWTVRNRLETNFRGCDSYKDCVLDPFQFSAFVPGQPKRDFYANLTQTSNVSGWQRTMALAFHVRYADDRLRPFDHSVRHFYSEQSMLNPEVPPRWVGNLIPVIPNRNFHLLAHRFRFYSGVQ